LTSVDLRLGDCLDVLPGIEAGSVKLCFVDPPYNIGIFCKMTPADYLAWCEQWIAECARALAPNGAFWVSHKDPRILGRIADMIETHGYGLINWVTWDKYNDAGDMQGFMDGYTVVDSLRSFQVMAEYLIYHADEGEWTAQCDRERGFIFEPLRAYLAGEWKRAGLTRRDLNKAVGSSLSGGGMASHYIGLTTQWSLPTREHYHQLRAYANAHDHGGEYLRREYEDLRREYEDLRREYEDLRYTFNNPGKVSSVWQFPPAPRDPSCPTPKPPALMERIIATTSNPGDLVLDPMMGGGTTGEACAQLGRDFVGIEINARRFKAARARIEAAQREMVQLTLEVSP